MIKCKKTSRSTFIRRDERTKQNSTNQNKD